MSKRMNALLVGAATAVTMMAAVVPASASTNDTATFLFETPYLNAPTYSKLATGYQICSDFETGLSRADAVSSLAPKVGYYTTALQVVDSASDHLCSDIAPAAQLRVRLESWSEPHRVYARELPGSYLFDETQNTETVVDRSYSVSGNGEYWAYVGANGQKPHPQYSLRCEMWLDGVHMVAKSELVASTLKCNFTSP